MSRRKRRSEPAAPQRSPRESLASGGAAPERSPSFGLWDWLFIVALLVAVVLVYHPAWQGGLIWDDDHHVTPPAIRSWWGLCRIWFDVKATQQYYPLLHSAFWIEHKLWGDAPLGYHLANILQHAVAAVLVALILRRLKVPGAYLAAAVFALHPVHVESVAWITEQKNTLSAMFYLSAMLVYLHFDQSRKAWLYTAALALFALGLCSKTVTATLPGALLVIFWWQRGRLSWRRDVLPLLPFFVLGAAAGVFTAWVERKLIGAEGAAFSLTLVERSLIAGRVIWFYLGKLLWPGELLFIYPRWQISQAVWWQYLFPLAAFLLVAALWAVRRRWRGPLAALLYFAGTLFPVLGFFNVYPFLYSFVADHFQYLASLGIIAMASAGMVLALDRRGLWRHPAGYAVCAVPLAILAGLTWQQSRMYTDIETLYRTTIARNPGCCMAYNNLGNVLADRGHIDEAIVEFRAALNVDPRHANAHFNLGNALASQSHYYEAITEYTNGLDIEPNCPSAYNNLGVTLADLGRFDGAIAHYQKALELQADYPEADHNFGLALAALGRLDEALVHYGKALKIKPDYFEAHNHLGVALARLNRIDEAVAEYRKALELKANYADAHYNLGVALIGRGQVDEAMAEYGKALKIKPDYAEAHHSLAVALFGRGKVDEAIAEYRKALEVRPDYAEAHHNLALALNESGKADEALAELQKTVELKADFAEARYNLGNALFGREKFEEAAAQYQKAVDINPNYAEFHANLGNALSNLGQLDAAAVQFRKALEIKPNFAEAHHGLGIVFAKRGRLDEAIAQFRKTLEIEPDFTSARENLTKALSLKGPAH
jgi:protein O-mannosyl-transferase